MQESLKNKIEIMLPCKLIFLFFLLCIYMHIYTYIYVTYV